MNNVAQAGDCIGVSAKEAGQRVTPLAKALSRVKCCTFAEADGMLRKMPKAILALGICRSVDESAAAIAQYAAESADADQSPDAGEPEPNG